MGHPNEDLIRQGYDAFSRGDMDTLRELFHPDVCGELGTTWTAAWPAPTSMPPAHGASRAWRTARGKRTAAG
jgi:ketosteroid isomerase-like protein